LLLKLKRKRYYSFNTFKTKTKWLKRYILNAMKALNILALLVPTSAYIGQSTRHPEEPGERVRVQRRSNTSQVSLKEHEKRGRSTVERVEAATSTVHESSLK
jgi:hypothetical protein